MFIAISEELMFRGIVLTFLRERYREAAAAAATAALFGLLHFQAGPVQVVMSGVFGYLLYLVRRVSGGSLLPIAVHLAWDLSVFASFTTASPESGSSASVALGFIALALVIVVVLAHRAVDLPDSGTAKTAPEGGPDGPCGGRADGGSGGRSRDSRASLVPKSAGPSMGRQLSDLSLRRASQWAVCSA